MDWLHNSSDNESTKVNAKKSLSLKTKPGSCSMWQIDCGRTLSQKEVVNVKW